MTAIFVIFSIVVILPGVLDLETLFSIQIYVVVGHIGQVTDQ